MSSTTEAPKGPQTYFSKMRTLSIGRVKVPVQRIVNGVVATINTTPPPFEFKQHALTLTRADDIAEIEAHPDFGRDFVRAGDTGEAAREIADTMTPLEDVPAISSKREALDFFAARDISVAGSLKHTSTVEDFKAFAKAKGFEFSDWL